MTNQIIWHQLDNESADERTTRLNAELHRIFFDSKPCYDESGEDAMCTICDEYSIPKHGTPRFLESLDAMQLIVTSGKFAEVREEFCHWLISEGKPAYECTILLYGKQHDRTRFTEKGYSRQEAFYLTGLKAMGYMVVTEGQGEKQ